MSSTSISHSAPGAPRPTRRRALFDARDVFYALLLLTRPATICDIGSCDGSAAFSFHRLLPRARVLAFEANPGNYSRIAADPRSAGIEVRHEAVSDMDGEVTFFVVDVPPDKPWARGSSSLNRRGTDIGLGLEERPVQVRSSRLDTALRGAAAPIALWVDVEGAAGQVVEGLEAIAKDVALVLVELEPQPLWEGQAAAADVIGRLSEFGFTTLATSPDSDRQDNVLLARGLRPWQVSMAKAVAFGAQVVRRLRGGRAGSASAR